MITLDMLRAAGVQDVEALAWLDSLNGAADEFGISTPRAVPWVANLAHECRGFTVLVESLSYSADRLMEIWPCTPRRVWGFTYDEARRYARKPAMIANRVYANRMGNGPESSGDGWRNRGRGPIMLTGSDNYREFGEALGIDLVSDPDLAIEPEVGARIAGRYWQTRGCNELADARDYVGIRRAVNGGTIGLDDVLARIEAIEAVA